MNLRIEIEEETDGRWLAEVETLPGVASYGATKIDAVVKAQAEAGRLQLRLHQALGTEARFALAMSVSELARGVCQGGPP